MGTEHLPALLPLAATVAVVCGARIRATRRRQALNRALHELRRPLQALALTPASDLPGGPPAAGSLELAVAALDDLDVAVNGSRPALRLRRVVARPLVAAAIERRRAEAARRQRSLSLRWRAGFVALFADPVRIAQALDNVLANAIEHGGLRVRVEATLCAAGLRVAVIDDGAGSGRRGRGPHRGHGLEVVRRIAAAHSGSFSLRRDGGTTVATLELPLASEAPVVVPLDLASRRPARRRSVAAARPGAERVVRPPAA